MPQVGVHRDSPARAALGGERGKRRILQIGNFVLGSLKFGRRRNRPLQAGAGLGLSNPSEEKHSDEELLEGQGPLLLIFLLGAWAQLWLRAGA